MSLSQENIIDVMMNNAFGKKVVESLEKDIKNARPHYNPKKRHKISQGEFKRIILCK